jgi:hypothetical protein
MANNKSLQTTDPKPQVYMVGGIVGLIAGVLAAYLYARAAQEEISRNGEAPRIQTMQLIGLLLAGMGLLRQIAELGKTPKK